MALVPAADAAALVRPASHTIMLRREDGRVMSYDTVTKPAAVRALIKAMRRCSGVGPFYRAPVSIKGVEEVVEVSRIVLCTTKKRGVCMAFMWRGQTHAIHTNIDNRGTIIEGLPALAAMGYRSPQRVLERAQTLSWRHWRTTRGAFTQQQRNKLRDAHAEGSLWIPATVFTRFLNIASHKTSAAAAMQAGLMGGCCCMDLVGQLWSVGCASVSRQISMRPQYHSMLVDRRSVAALNSSLMEAYGPHLQRLQRLNPNNWAMLSQLVIATVFGTTRRQLLAELGLPRSFVLPQVLQGMPLHLMKSMKTHLLWTMKRDERELLGYTSIKQFRDWVGARLATFLPQIEDLQTRDLASLQLHGWVKSERQARNDILLDRALREAGLLQADCDTQRTIQWALPQGLLQPAA